jgi:phage terminase small subunit
VANDDPGQQPRYTAREQAFCKNWLVTMNASEAARRSGYSEKAAAAIGAELLRKPKIQARIEEMRSEVAETVGLSPHMLAAELKRIALSDIGDFVDFGPRGVKLKHSDQVDTRCVAEVSESTTKDGGSIRFKLHDKKGAIDSLNKMFGWNAAEKQELSGPKGGAIPIETKVVVVELPSNGRGNPDRSSAGPTD